MTEKSARKRLDLLSFPKQSQVDSTTARQSVVTHSIQPPIPTTNQPKVKSSTSRLKTNLTPKRKFQATNKQQVINSIQSPTPKTNQSKVKSSTSRPKTNSTAKKERQTTKTKPKFQVVKVSSTSASAKKKKNTNSKSASASSTSKSFKLVYSSLFIFFRLAIMVVGGAAIAGTILAAVNQNHQFKANQSDDTDDATVVAASELSPQPLTPSDNSDFTVEELSGLISKLEQIIDQYPDLEPGVFLLDLDNGGYVNLNGSKTFAAASTIKIPILVALLEAVDADKVYLDEQLVMEPELIVGGSGDMQYQPPGSKYSVLETARKMIVISDNTATNMLVERLGGQAVVNQRFREWGLNGTTINNPLPDLDGTNTTSPEDLVTLLQKIERGEILSWRSRDRLIAIMQQTKTRSLLPEGLEPDATIAHKTGDIGTMLGDAGIVDMPTGKRYLAAVLVNRPHNDPQGKKLIQEISRTAYQHFKWYQPRDSFTVEDE